MDLQVITTNLTNKPALLTQKKIVTKHTHFYIRGRSALIKVIAEMAKASHSVLFVEILLKFKKMSFTLSLSDKNYCSLGIPEKVPFPRFIFWFLLMKNVVLVFSGDVLFLLNSYFMLGK